MKALSMNYVWLSLLLVAGNPASAAVQVVTSLPDLAWAAQEIGKEHVEVRSLLKGSEDPHYADAVPEYIRLVSDADVVCQVGLELEVGWLPKVLSRSGNAKVQANGPGHCDLGKSVETLEKPTGPIDRSMGDVHPQGNPHFWLSPKALAQGSKEIRDALTRVDPAHEEAYRKNYAEFAKRMDALLEKEKKKLAPLLSKVDGPVILEYHREFAYFLHDYGIRSAGSIEEKPGVPPSAGRLAELAKNLRNAHLKAILATDYNPRRTIERMSELSGISPLVVQSSIQPKGAFKDYVALQDHLVDSLVKAMESVQATK